MSIYTVSPCFMTNIDASDMDYFRKVLFSFLNGSNKVAKDEKGRVIEIYSGISKYGDIIHAWLSLMSFKPSRFEPITIDLDQVDGEENKFLMLCSRTKGQHKMIVYSIQNVSCEVYNVNRTDYEGVTVELLGKDDAVNELSTKSIVYNVTDSVIAGGNVENSNNTK